ncbi:hypothetical protein MUP01_01560 [Candidatus Bathyarchaeota archaeon]|nr:hypothetical protein [Candidatus Bathyarchaeota archaeon]
MGNQKHTSTNKKEEQISRVIDRVLTHVFGREATQLIYKYMEHNYSLKHDEIVERIDIFAKGLEAFLNSGANVVEREILTNVYSDHDLLLESEPRRASSDSGFADQVKCLLQRA